MGAFGRGGSAWYARSAPMSSSTLLHAAMSRRSRTSDQTRRRGMRGSLHGSAALFRVHIHGENQNPAGALLRAGREVRADEMTRGSIIYSSKTVSRRDTS